ncbi:MAG: DUF6174 domain-containing protein [Myxococcales bacterium]
MGASLSGVVRFSVVAGVIAIAACGDESEPNPRVERVDAAIEQWDGERPDDYVFAFSYSCYCDNDTVRVVVRAGKVVEAKLASGAGAPDDRRKTIDDLFVDVRSWAEEDPEEWSLELDPEWNYPRRVQLDVSKGVADDEGGLIVSCFSPGTAEDVCPLAEEDP